MSDILHVALTGLGILVLAAGMYFAQKLRHHLGTGSLKNAWDVLSVFIAFFIVGYVAFLLHMVTGAVQIDPLLLTAVVFFAGSIFVAMTSYYNLKALTA